MAAAVGVLPPAVPGRDAGLIGGWHSRLKRLMENDLRGGCPNWWDLYCNNCQVLSKMTIIFYLHFCKEVIDQNVRFSPYYEGSTFNEAGIRSLTGTGWEER